MKAITVRQPWAYAIAARWDSDEAVRRVAELTKVLLVTTDTSAIVAVAELEDIHHSDTCVRPAGERYEHEDGPFRCSRWAIGLGFEGGMYHWQLGNRRQLAYPVPCKGRLGLWDLPADVEAAVLGQIGATR